jgi:hypothetical protein
MNKTIRTATAVALAMSMGAATAPGVFAKAHDQGVADGSRTPGEPNTGGAGDFAAGGTVSTVVSGGARGDQASDPETGRSENNGDKGLGRDNGQGQGQN